ncbi:MAG: HAD-IIIC family phosphatase [Caldisericia bacterium]
MERIDSADLSAQLNDYFTEFLNNLNTLSSRLSNSVIFVDNFHTDGRINSNTLSFNSEQSPELMITHKNIELQQFIKSHKNFKIVDVNQMISQYGQENLFDYKYHYLAKCKWNSKGTKKLSELYYRHLKAHLGLRKKCIVLDLDNTLWGGIIGQDGLENILLSNDGLGKSFYDFQKLLLNLYNKGIILTVCSKNSQEIVNKVFEKHPFMVLRKEHFAVMKINWRNKTENIIEIAKELNIGLDSIVFIDDSEFEKNLIRQQLPNVTVPDLPNDPTYYSKFISELDYFCFHNITAEDINRNKSYKENFERLNFQKSFKSFEDYLFSLETVIEIKPINDFTFPRILQLIQKTNQFNTTTKRYTETELRNLWLDDSFEIYSFGVKDRFGDNGIVGVLILKKDNQTKKLFIDSFIMSCRVIGRKIETALLSFIFQKAKASGFEIIVGEIIPTSKNEPCRLLYKEHNFILSGDNLWEFKVNSGDIPLPEYFTLKDE